MIWQACFPTQIYFGPGIVGYEAANLTRLGKRALIVTGSGGSAVRNGALDDITAALAKMDITWELFNRVETNPSIENIREGAAQATAMQAEFVIGIGGGSPMDAAKAIAICNLEAISDEQLINLEYKEALPIVLVPTTAGTGSEVTPASILTSHQHKTKKNVGSALLIPAMAFLDPVYTVTLPVQITVDTAVDAYSHAIESFLSQKNTPISSLYSIEAMRILGPKLQAMVIGTEVTLEDREDLLYASYLAGVAISLTGTSIPHAVGYSLTYYKGIPHGRANGFVMPAWMQFNIARETGGRSLDALKYSGFASLEEFSQTLELLCGPGAICNTEELARFKEHTLQAKNTYNNLVVPNSQDITEVLEHSLAMRL